MRAVTWRMEDGGNITVEYYEGPPSSFKGTSPEARVLADRYFGKDQTRLEVYGGTQWIRGA